MARGVLGAAYSVDKNAYNKGVADELNLQALQRANTARRMITSNNNYGVTQPDAYQNPFDSPIQEQGRVMPDPRAGGQYMTVPGSEQDKMLADQDKMNFPDSPPKVVLPRASVIRQATRQKQDVGLGSPRPETGGMIFGLGPRFTGDPKMVDEAVLSRDIAGNIAFQTFQPGDSIPGLFTGTTTSPTIKSDDEPEAKGILFGAGPKFKTQTEETTEEVIVNNTGKKVTLDKTKLSELLESSNDSEPRDAEIKDITSMGVIIRMREDQVNKPSKGLGQVARDMIEDRKFITNKIMRNQRLAEVYRRVGDATNYQAALTASDSLRQELREYDNAITLAIGKDALADLNYSNNASRVSQVLSRILNRNIEIVPNSYDNKFTMLVDGQVREQGLSKAQMSDRVNSLTDSGYRQQKIKTRMEQAKMLFQGNIDKDKELTVLLGNIKLETLKGKVQAMIERIKADNTLNIKAFNDGTAILQTGPGQFMFFNPYSPDPLNEGGTMPMFKSLSMPYTNTQANPYKQGFKKPE
jgi:hypothetical protein